MVKLLRKVTLKCNDESMVFPSSHYDVEMEVYCRKDGIWPPVPNCVNKGMHYFRSTFVQLDTKLYGYDVSDDKFINPLTY